MTDLRLVSDRSVNAGLIVFPVERWPWKTMSEEQAQAHITDAVVIARTKPHHRQLKMAQEVLARIADLSPHAAARNAARLALYIYFGDGTEPPSAA